MADLAISNRGLHEWHAPAEYEKKLAEDETFRRPDAMYEKMNDAEDAYNE